MYIIKTTKRFEKDVKLCVKRIYNKITNYIFNKLKNSNNENS